MSSQFFWDKKSCSFLHALDIWPLESFWSGNVVLLFYLSPLRCQLIMQFCLTREGRKYSKGFSVIGRGAIFTLPFPTKKEVCSALKNGSTQYNERKQRSVSICSLVPFSYPEHHFFPSSLSPTLLCCLLSVIWSFPLSEKDQVSFFLFLPFGCCLCL